MKQFISWPSKMKRGVRTCCLTAVLVPVAMQAGAVVVKTDIQQRVGDRTVAIRYYSPSVVRVTVWPGSGKMPEKKSFSVIMKPEKSARHQVSIDLNEQTGALCFLSAEGDTLLLAGTSAFTPCTHAVDKGKYEVTQTFRLKDDEVVYGLGQLRDTAMNWRGRHIRLWNNNTYISIPYITSNRGWGLYWDNAGRSFFDDDSEKGTSFRSEVAPMIDYYFIYRDGTQDGVIAGIRQLTGQATMFPKWTLGFWQCRERYKTSDQLAEVLDRYRQLHIPLDGIVQDWQYWGCDSNWNAMRFQNPYYINKVGDPAWAKYLPQDLANLPKQQEPRLKSPEEMVKFVHDNNAHLMISIWASFGPWTAQYKELKEMGALLPFVTWPLNSGTQPYDAFNPKARDLYWRYLTPLYRMGMDAWWTDSSEPDHFEKPGDDDYLTYAGSWRSVKNAFPLEHNRGIYEHQRAMKGNWKRSIQMTRSGSFGLQHYGTFSWSGDIQASWDEMKKQIPSGLNFSLCGIPYWNTDLGGFFHWDYNNDPKNVAQQELQTRWIEWGCFLPVMRSHSSSPMLPELYQFGLEGDWAYDAMLAAVKLRYRLLPYSYSAMGDVMLNSGTVMRPLVMDFAADSLASRLNDEYMYGRSLLVHPVTDPLYTWKDSRNNGHAIYPDVRQAAAPVSVYLPKGTKWYDFWTNEVLDGGQTVMRPCPIDILPVYVKAGTVMPFGPDVQYSSEKPWDDLEIRVYPGANGTFTLYEDEGDGYNYEKGAYSLIRFDYDDATRTLTIQPREGKYKGMLASRRFRVVLVNGQSGRGDLPMQGARSVEYKGKKISVTL